MEPRFVKNGRVTSQVVSIKALSETDQQAWRRFLAPRPQAFLSYPYARAVASCVPSVRVCRLMQDGRVAGFFSFQYSSSAHAAAGIGQRLGGEMSDYFGLVAEPGFRIAERDLLRFCGLRSLAFSNLDESQGENGLAGDKPEVGHRIDFPQGGKAFWEEKERQDKKFVSDTERRERKLIREYGEMRFTFSEENPAALLGELIAFKRAQYHRTGVADALRAKRTRDILYALCGTRDEQCHGTVSTLYAGDTWVASHFGLRSGSTLHFWFPVYNPELRAFAPGRILLKQIILGTQLGLERIDRGAGDSVAKRDFSTSQHYFFSGLWQRPGIAALAHRVELGVSWRLADFRARGAHVSE
jgi:CelD/BcsL family acetyltransferase involved in cellulose biosynthesis